MANQQIELRKLSPDQWPEISRRFDDLTYEQTLTYALAAADRIGASAEFLGMFDRYGMPVAAACLRVKKVPILGRGVAWIASGPLTCTGHGQRTVSETLGVVLSGLREYTQGAGHVLRFRLPVSASPHLDVITEAGFVRSERSQTYRTVLIDLNQSEADLMKAQHGKWRNSLRKALKADLDIQGGPITEFSDRFSRLYQQVRSSKGFQPDIPPEFFYRLSGSDFEHDVLVARKGGEDIGAMTIGYAGTTATYLFGATSEAGRRLNAGHYLMWQAMLHCRRRGTRWFDLGGIDPEGNPSVTRFKVRTGGTDVTAAGPFELRPAGMTPSLIKLAESLHRKVKL